MTLSRRNALKLGLGAGASALLPGSALSEPASAAPRPAGDPGGGTVRARPLPLSAVRLTGGPLKHAQDLMATYLLRLDPDRMLAYYRERAGLPRKAEAYDGWDGGGRNLTGHIAGHHLSAVSLMFAATGDARFKTRVDYIVRELKEVQDKHGDGYLSRRRSTSTACGRPGTRCTRRMRACGTPTATPATAWPSRWKRSSQHGPKAFSRSSATSSSST